jgi:hypothetical protein
MPIYVVALEILAILALFVAGVLTFAELFKPSDEYAEFEDA